MCHIFDNITWNQKALLFLFVFISSFFFLKKDLSSNRGPDRESKGINTFAPVKNKNMPILVSSIGRPLCYGGKGTGLLCLDHP